MPANALSLQILPCSCTCGNSWTHSYYILYGNGHYGGTPSGVEELLPVTNIFQQHPRHFAVCFRCAPMIQVTKAPPKAPLSARKTKPILDLDKELFG